MTQTVYVITLMLCQQCGGGSVVLVAPSCAAGDDWADSALQWAQRSKISLEQGPLFFCKPYLLPLPMPWGVAL